MKVTFAALLIFTCLLSQASAATCDCYDDAGACLDVTEWSTLCNLSTLNYSILGAMSALGVIALILDHTLYKSVEFWNCNIKFSVVLDSNSF